MYSQFWVSVPYGQRRILRLNLTMTGKIGQLLYLFSNFFLGKKSDNLGPDNLGATPVTTFWTLGFQFSVWRAITLRLFRRLLLATIPAADWRLCSAIFLFPELFKVQFSKKRLITSISDQVKQETKWKATHLQLGKVCPSSCNLSAGWLSVR